MPLAQEARPIECPSKYGETVLGLGMGEYMSIDSRECIRAKWYLIGRRAESSTTAY